MKLRLRASRELVQRWMLEEFRQQPVLTNPRAVRDYLAVHYAGQEREVFGVMFLDNRHRLLVLEEMFLGTVDGASVHPREVVKRALKLNAAAVILAHNHPSGVAEPGRRTGAVTVRIRRRVGPRGHSRARSLDRRWRHGDEASPSED